MIRSWFRLCCFGLAAGSLLTGCGDDAKTTEPTPSPYRPQSSIENVLFNLKESYVRRDLEEYRALFAPDFTFAFSPEDTYGQSEIPPSWNLLEEFRAADSLLNSPKVLEVNLLMSFSQTAVDSAGSGTWKIRAQPVQLRVRWTTVDGHPLVYQVSDAWESFCLRRYPQDLASDGLPLWRITRWADCPISDRGNPGTETTTWGMIKYAFSR